MQFFEKQLSFIELLIIVLVTDFNIVSTLLTKLEDKSRVSFTFSLKVEEHEEKY
jgi:hypothetical protein